jgi:uncharacterized membrane protein required for colicin V production
MNWTDLIVIGIVAGFAIVGMFKGFILSVYRLASYFLSIFLAIKLYPVISNVLSETALYGKISRYILKNLLKQQPGLDNSAKTAAAETVVEGLRLPGFFKDFLITKFPNPSKIIDVSGIMNTISDELTKIIIAVISMVVLYILIRLLLIFARSLIKGLSKLPVIKQVDKIGGFTLGAVEGFLTAFIVLAVLTIFSTSPNFKGISSAIDGSLITGYMYNNNFIINWLFPKNA